MSPNDLNCSARFNNYISKTYHKTASLMALSCKAVAQLALNTIYDHDDVDPNVYSQSDLEQKVKDAYDYGRNVGIAFQLVDDYLDFVADAKQMGKPTATDMR